MAVVIDKTEPIDGSEKNKWIYITVEIGSDSYKFMHTAPPDLNGDALQDYVNSKEYFYQTEIYRNMYVGADCYDLELADWEQWISGGCTNTEVRKTDINGDEIVTPETVIEKKTWVDTH